LDDALQISSAEEAIPVRPSVLLLPPAKRARLPTEVVADQERAWESEAVAQPDAWWVPRMKTNPTRKKTKVVWRIVLAKK
jgi:hypothetical protein